MRSLPRILALCLVLAPGTAQAEWRMDDVSDDKGRLLIAYANDSSDYIEFQVICDGLLDNRYKLLLFTGADIEQKKEWGRQVPVDVVPNAVSPVTLDADIVIIDGEIVLSALEDGTGQVRRAISAVAKADTVTLRYRDADWTVGNDGAREKLGELVSQCDS